MSEKHFRTCNLCEAICGIEIEYEGGSILSIKGDKLDPFSRGHICPKALALKEIYESKDRLRMPVKRIGNEFHEIGWEEAFDETVGRLTAIQREFGRDAVGVFQGNPSVHNLGTMLSSGGLLKALKTRNNYSATSVDQLPHHFAAWAMFGHPLLIPIPDIDRTGYFLIFGANPIASNGSLMTAPDIVNRLDSITKRGGKVVLIDPRRTESARVASEHHFIQPGSDVYFLLAIVNALFAENLIKPGRLVDFTDGIDRLREATGEFTADLAESKAGIPAAEIKRIAREFAAADSAVCYGRMGVSVQEFGGLCHWLINAINVLTGNCDRAGGAMFTSPAFDLLQTAKPGENIYGRWHSRVRKLPEFMGELPVAALAEEISTEGEGQIRALVTNCGNPVLSTPNGTQLERGLSALDFMVSIDIAINETTRHASIILPPATGLEVSHYDAVFNLLAVRNVAKYSAPMFEKADGAKFDWEIIQELTHRFSNSGEPLTLIPPETRLDLGLRFGRYGLSIGSLAENPHGLDLGPLEPALPERLLTSDKRIQIAPEMMIADLERVGTQQDETDSSTFALIGRRNLRDNNSWLHSSEILMKGRNRCTLMINSNDAGNLDLANGGRVRVTSRVGSIELECEITDDIAPRVVSIPHGYGHARDGFSSVALNAGVSVNDLTDELKIDQLTGNAALTGVRVRISAI
ncbi:MAG: molybdopterin-dependent oxidoreductase [Acidobacteria bacterium]|nr:molybdopterin-dependent oxidoreductase [Acidobacteriota bacterium]